MCSNHAFYQTFSSKSGKLFSVTNDGKLSFKGVHEIHSYMLSQGVNLYSYVNESRDELYFLLAAETMISLGENKWATNCYLYALENAFRLQLEGKLHNVDRRANISPTAIYEKATKRLLQLGDMREYNRFKKKMLKFLKSSVESAIE